MRRLLIRLLVPLTVIALLAIVVVPRLSDRSTSPAGNAAVTSNPLPPTTSPPTTPTTIPSTPVASTTSPPTTTEAGVDVTFAAAGDLGARDETAAVLTAVRESDARFMLALGDLSYDQIKPESGWCDWVLGQIGERIPLEIVVGNHEDDDGPNGYIGNFAACLPDQMASAGTYGVQYFFDVGLTVRVIMVAAGTTVAGEDFNYAEGSEQEAWLLSAIRDARKAGIRWIVVGGHKPCISVGKKKCESGRHLADLLIDEGVDLVLYGHDHNYQRTFQLSCVTVNSFDSACVSDRSDEPVAGNGTIFVVSGITGMKNPYPVDGNDPEAPYFADFMGGNSPEVGYGYVEIGATPETLELRFVGVTTSFTDGFVIHQ